MYSIIVFYRPVFSIRKACALCYTMSDVRYMLCTASKAFRLGVQLHMCFMCMASYKRHQNLTKAYFAIRNYEHIENYLHCSGMLPFYCSLTCCYFSSVCRKIHCQLCFVVRSVIFVALIKSNYCLLLTYNTKSDTLRLDGKLSLSNCHIFVHMKCAVIHKLDGESCRMSALFDSLLLDSITRTRSEHLFSRWIFSLRNEQKHCQHSVFLFLRYQYLQFAMFVYFSSPLNPAHPFLLLISHCHRFSIVPFCFQCRFVLGFCGSFHVFSILLYRHISHSLHSFGKSTYSIAALCLAPWTEVTEYIAMDCHQTCKLLKITTKSSKKTGKWYQYSNFNDHTLM